MDIKILSPEDAAAIAVGVDITPVSLTDVEQAELADKLNVVWAIYTEKDPALSDVLVFDYDGLDAFLIETNDGLRHLALSTMAATLSKLIVSVVVADACASEDIVLEGELLTTIDDADTPEEAARKALIAAQHATQEARYAEHVAFQALKVLQLNEEPHNAETD